MDTTITDGNQLALSAITMVEIVYLVEKGRVPKETYALISSHLQTAPVSSFEEIPVDMSVTLALETINRQQVPDMPDRIIAATAKKLAVPLISRDGRIQLSDVETLW